MKKRKKRQKRQKWRKWRFWWFLRFKRGFFILWKHPKILKIWCDAFFPSQISAPNVSCFFNFRCSKRLMSVTRIKGLFLTPIKGIQPLDTMKIHETFGAVLQTPHVLKKISVGNTGRKKNYFFFRDFSCFFSDRIFTKFFSGKKHTFSVLQTSHVFWKTRKTRKKNSKLEIFFQKKALKNPI